MYFILTLTHKLKMTVMHQDILNIPTITQCKDAGRWLIYSVTHSGQCWHSLPQDNVSECLYGPEMLRAQEELRETERRPMTKSMTASLSGSMTPACCHLL